MDNKQLEKTLIEEFDISKCSFNGFNLDLDLKYDDESFYNISVYNEEMLFVTDEGATFEFLMAQKNNEDKILEKINAFIQQKNIKLDGTELIKPLNEEDLFIQIDEFIEAITHILSFFKK